MPPITQGQAKPAFPWMPVAAAGGTLMNFLGAQSASRRQNKLRQQLMDLLSPERLSSEANQLFDMFRSSPMYGGMRRNAMIGSAGTANQLQTSIARAGLGRSGIGAIAPSLARGSLQTGLAGIDMDLFARALAEARQSLQGRAGVLSGTSGPGTGSLFAGGMLESIMPLLAAYFAKQQKT